MDGSLRLVLAFAAIALSGGRGGLAAAVVDPGAGPGARALVAARATVAWRAAEGRSPQWSDPANWQGGIVPGPFDVVRFDARSSDAILDAAFAGAVAGIVLERGYAGTLRLERELTVSGVLRIADGRLEQGDFRLAAAEMRQTGGTFVGGAGPLWIEGAASVSGGVLQTPRNRMRVWTLDIWASGVVRVGPNGRLELAGDGTPLTGHGLLDTTTNRPTSVEYTGRATSDLTAGGPAVDYHRLKTGHERDGDLRRQMTGRKATRHFPVPLAFGDPETAVTLKVGEDVLHSAVIDTAGGYAYVGTGRSPGIVVKVRLSDFTRVGALTLDAGEDNLSYAAIDLADGFAYFGTWTSPGIVVKVRLSDFSRAGALTLGAGENEIHSAVIDAGAGFGYFGTSTSPGIVVKVRLSDFTRVGTLTLNAGEDIPRTAVIDAAGGFAYFAAGTSPGIVVKVRLTDFTRAGALTLNTGEDGLFAAAIDVGGGFAYFGTATFPGIVVKVRLSDFTRVGALTLNTGENELTSAVIDEAGGFAYFGTFTAPGIVVKVRLSDFTRAGGLTLDTGEDQLHAAAIDVAGGFAYFGTWTSPGLVVKVRLSDFTRADALTLGAGENILHSAVIDEAGGFAYFGTELSPGIVVKVRLSDFTRVGALTLNTGENSLHSAVIDVAGGFAYFGTWTLPGRVIKIRLSDFTRVGALTLNAGEGRLQSAAIDAAGGFAYFGTQTLPGVVVKVRLSDFTRVGALTLNTGENELASAMIDEAAGFAYFGTYTAPGIVVKVRLSDFAIVGTLTLNTGEDNLASAVIDAAGGFAYFGTYTGSPGVVVKVRLSDFTEVGALTLDTGESGIHAAVIDPAAGFACFGTDTSPGVVVKVRLSDFNRVGKLALGTGEDELLTAVIDRAAGFGYFGTGTYPGLVIRVDLSPVATMTSVVSSANPAVSAQNVTFTATVTPASVGGNPTGTMQFQVDGVNLGAPTTLAGGVATQSTSALAPGTHAITAAYSGDAAFRSSIGVLSSGQTVYVPSTATVTGMATICVGNSTIIQAVLTGTPPWSITWSDAMAQTGVLTSPATRSVSPATTTTYTVAAVSDAKGPGSSTGSAAVTVDPLLPAPVISAPATVGAGSPNRTASVLPNPGSTYTWTLGNGTITSGQGTSQILFTAGTAGIPLTLSVIETNTAAFCPSAPGNAIVSVVSVGAAALFYAVTPCRLLDTRNPIGPLGGPGMSPAEQRVVTMVGNCGIPVGAVAISANVTVTQPTAPGHLTLFAGNLTPPPTSNVSFSPGQTRANNAILGVSTDGTGRVAVLNGSVGTVHFVVDVNGYFQ